MYTIREFRLKLKEAFDNAEVGEDIRIKRNNKVFSLKFTTELLPIKQKSLLREDYGTCKYDGFPLDNRGKCLKKGCKNG